MDQKIWIHLELNEAKAQSSKPYAPLRIQNLKQQLDMNLMDQNHSLFNANSSRFFGLP